jgi:hypothetical protein
MPSETVDHKTLRHLVAAGPVQATAVADGDKWALVFKIGKINRTLTAVHSREVKVFKKLDTVAKYLQELGITHFDTDTRNYDPAQKSTRRPDKSKALKEAHQAAAYDKWFRANVQAAIEEVDNGGPLHTTEDVRTSTTAIIDKARRKKRA